MLISPVVLLQALILYLNGVAVVFRVPYEEPIYDRCVRPAVFYSQPCNFYSYKHVVGNVSTASKKKPKPYNQMDPAPKSNNPNFVRDRLKIFSKPQMPDILNNRDRKPFNPAWMDYCDPYHCNDYHKIACGLNRNNMKFKWFQSQCHIILNNECANYRGSLKYDIVDSKFCMLYVMHLREGCPRSCDDEVTPICGVSTVKNHAVLFKNRCALEMANCGAILEEYQELHMDVCDYYLRHA